MFFVILYVIITPASFIDQGVGDS